VAITDHGYRSVTGVPYPLDLNAASMNELTTVPGIGDRTAGDIVVDRPYESVGDVAAVDGTNVDLADFVTVRSAEAGD